MSIREDVELYTKLSGEDGSQETIATIGAYLRGYGQGKEDAEPHWHPVSEQPQEEDDYLLLTHEKFKHGTFKRIIIGAWNNATKEWLEEYGDMYRAVNHPVAWMSKEELLLLKGYEVTE